MSQVPSQGSSAGLLIDTNLLVLLIVGMVNPSRIAGFKRTSKYSRSDFELLRSQLARLTKPLYTVAHVMAEVSNLTDMTGKERVEARRALQQTAAILMEPVMASLRATGAKEYETLGLVDGAIATVAREHHCAVLTDDLMLYRSLLGAGIEAFNFAHLQEAQWRG